MAASLGRIAYGAFVKAKFLAEGYREAPAWAELPEVERQAWDDAADAVTQDVCGGARCAECFEPMTPTTKNPGLWMCPTHRPEGI